MKEINIKDLKVRKRIGSGYFSNVYIGKLLEKKYAFKLYNEIYKEFIDAIEPLTDREFTKEFLTPRFLVVKHNRYIGYLSDYKECLENLFDTKVSLEDKIKLLKQVRVKIEKLHKEYNLIHGDINFDNVLFDMKEKEPYFLDFDMSITNGETYNSKIILPEITDYYLENEKLDYKLDIYMFNIMVLSIYCGVENCYHAWLQLLHGSLDLSNTNNDVKRICKKMDLEENRGHFSGEYIIDYF